MTSNKPYRPKYPCFECKKSIGARRSHLFDEEVKDYRCKKCWNIYIEKQSFIKENIEGLSDVAQ